MDLFGKNKKITTIQIPILNLQNSKFELISDRYRFMSSSRKVMNAPQCGVHFVKRYP